MDRGRSFQRNPLERRNRSQGPDTRYLHGLDRGQRSQSLPPENTTKEYMQVGNLLDSLLEHGKFTNMQEEYIKKHGLTSNETNRILSGLHEGIEAYQKAYRLSDMQCAKQFHKLGKYLSRLANPDSGLSTIQETQKRKRSSSEEDAIQETKRRRKSSSTNDDGYLADSESDTD